MLILHTSDLHLGKTVYERNLIDDQRAALSAIVGIARDEKPAVVLIAGDIFDRSVPSPEAVLLFGTFLAELRALGQRPVIIAIPGNHDSATRVSYCAQILSSADVHIRALSSSCDEAIEIMRDGERCRFWALPFLGPGSFSGMLENSEEPALRSQDELMKIAVSRIIERKRDDDKIADVLVCHAFAKGGMESGSERRFLGSAELVNPEVFSDFDYVALGHLHGAQDSGSNGRYSGSPMAYSFSECSAAKTVSLVEVHPGGFTERKIPVKAGRPMRRISGFFATLIEERPESDLADSYIEATLKDEHPIPCPLEPLRRLYPYLLSVRQTSMELEPSDRPLRTSASDDPSSGARADPSTVVRDDFLAFYEEILDASPDRECLGLFMEFCAEASREAP